MKIILSLTILLLLGLALSQEVPANCSNPVYSAQSFKDRNQTRPRYASEPAISNLTNCKLFSNKSSCCNKTTDDDISVVFQNYKQILANLTSKKFRSLKKGFEDYANIDYKNLSNSDKAAGDVKKKVDEIKANMTEMTKNIVACAQAALKLTAGLLCSGCNPYWGKFVKNNKLILSNNSCHALSNACFKIINSYNNLQNDSRANLANLTDTITTYVGEDLPVNSDNFSSRILEAPTFDPKSNRLPGIDANFDVKTYCGSWVSGGLAKAENCLVCYLPDWASLADKSEDALLKAFNDISPECLKSNPLLVSLKKWIDEAGDKYPYLRMMSIAQAFQSTYSENGYFAVLLTLDDGTKINIGSSNAKLNTALVKFFKSANSTAKSLKLYSLNNAVNSSLYTFTYGFLSVVMPGSPLLLPIEVFDSIFKSSVPQQSNCMSQGFSLAYEESKLKLQDNLQLSISVNDQKNALQLTYLQTGATEKSAPVSTTFQSFFEKCTGTTLNLAESPSFMYLTYYKGVTACYSTGSNTPNCFIARKVALVLPANRSNQTKEMASESYANLKKSGQDPRRVSPTTGRKVPDNVNLPDTVNASTEFTYVPPCSNVSDCAKWFCTYGVQGAFASLEKILNPQVVDNTGEESGASDGYNVNLAKSVRLLANAVTSDVSTDGQGLNFFAVSENSALPSSIVIDNVSEASASYDASIQANTTLDSSSSGDKISSGGSGGGSGGSFSAIQSILLVFTFLPLYLFF